MLFWLSRMDSFRLSDDLTFRLYDLMVRSRALEERLIRMYKQNDGFFWIGGPGEEAVNVSLGLLLKKGQGPSCDYFHGHYRSGAVLLAMGAHPLDSMRQMKSTATDPYSGGRNFVGHPSRREWNVAPITSPIEVQFSIAPGTAMANKRAGGGGITVVVGGDAGTAEGDFATCLVWSSRPGNELPVLMVVTNNGWGISTSAASQHAEKRIADRAKAFGIRTAAINGLDAENAYLEIERAMDYVRRTQKPFLLEATVSRLYGHSSASGANLVTSEIDPIAEFEKKLLERGLLTPARIEAISKKYNDEMLRYARQARKEAQPDSATIEEHIFRGVR